MIVTRNGKNAAVLYPLHDPNKVPLEVRRQLFLEMSARIGKQLGTSVPEEEIARDFAAYQERRRRR